MTVKTMKEILSHYDDNDRVIVDNGEVKASSANEVIFAIKVSRANGNFSDDGKSTFPVVILQTKQDFDVSNELDAQFARFSKENWDEADALYMLADWGFVLEDFKYNEVRYNWAKRVAEEHGIW